MKNNNVKSWVCVNQNGTYKGDKTNLNKRKCWLIFGAVIVFLILATSIVLSVVFGVEINKLKSSQQQTFLTPLNVELFENQSNTMAISLLNNIVSGVSYNQQVKMVGSNLKSEQVVRCKTKLINSNNQEFDVVLTAPNNWILGTDGYYYFNGRVNGLTEQLIFDQIILPEGFSSNTKNKGSHYLIVTVECLNFSSAFAKNVWNSAPSDWLNSFGSGIE